MPQSESQIVVVGGGPVGLAFAIAAHALPHVRVTVIERRLDFPALSTTFDHRVYALSPASQRFLEWIGVWARNDVERLTMIRAMRVFGDGAEGVEPDDLPAMKLASGQSLATMIEHGQLMRSLIAEAEARTIDCRRGSSVAAMNRRDGGRRQIALDDGTEIEADLVVAADGRASRLRAMADIDVIEKNYASRGIVANFYAEKPHGGEAWQWFSPAGVLAYLPMPGQQISVVWSVADQQADALMALSDNDFCAAVQAAGHNALGALRLTSRREAVPLMRITARQWAQPGLALMGDAAHAVHPLAGQGLNLGLGDAECLAAVLRERSAFSAVGDIALLRRYVRARTEEALMMGAVTDRLRGLYLVDDVVSQSLRRRGIALVDHLPLVKHLAIEYAAHRR